MRHYTVALIGNPNTGKSTLFTALSGVRQHIANYPGATVEKKQGTYSHNGARWNVVDLPGAYSLSPRSPDEMIAVDVLLGRRGDVEPPDVVLCVLDATNLNRNMYLLSQVLEMGRPCVVALSMVDIARARGLTIDVAGLQARLGVPVIPIQANRGIGVAQLREAAEAVVGAPPPERPQLFPAAFQTEVDQLSQAIEDPVAHREGNQPNSHRPSRYLVERLLLDQGGYIESTLLPHLPREVRAELERARERLEHADCRVSEVETGARYRWVQTTLEGLIGDVDLKKPRMSERIDSVLTHPFWGMIVLGLILVVMFQSVFQWASLPMDLIDAGVSWVGEQVEQVMPEGTLRSLLVDGVIGGVGSVIIFLPQILILFLFLALLEDCGYLARAAYLMDRWMVRFGLNGKSFIPLLSSFACAIPGVMAARVVDERRDRLTTILIAPLMSCSARLPVYALLTAAFIPDRPVLGTLLNLQGLTFLGLYLLGIATAAVAAWIFKRTILRGGTNSFVMELPPYRMPSPRVVLTRMFERGWIFLKGAGTLILAVAIVMWAALYFPRLSESAGGPLLESKAALENRLAAAEEQGDEPGVAELKGEIAAIDSQLSGAQSRNSYLGRFGRLIEPVVKPLGWDWRIGSAALASFPAREVVVASLGVIFDVGEDAGDEARGGRLQQALRSAVWPDTGQPLFTVPVALSIMVFFALCAQCVSTLAIMKRETNSWKWPAFSFVYMTVLAYVAAFITYQVGSRIG